MRRRASGILSLPRWITDEDEPGAPEGADGASAGGDAESLLDEFEKLLFQNSEPGVQKTPNQRTKNRGKTIGLNLHTHRQHTDFEKTQQY